jgi:zinc protease
VEPAAHAGQSLSRHPQGFALCGSIPIGKPEIIQNGKQERLKQFYADWYRPDLMAVVAVGDFDKAAMEKMLNNHFASIPAATSPRPSRLMTCPIMPKRPTRLPPTRKRATPR